MEEVHSNKLLSLFFKLKTREWQVELVGGRFKTNRSRSHREYGDFLWSRTKPRVFCDQMSF